MNSELAANLVQISGYRILREVGRGGIATVYLAVQRSLQREVALKVMSPALTTDPNFTDRFMREGRTIAQMNHPGIVTIYDIAVDDFNHYIAMEYLKGASLKQRIKNCIPVDQALDILHQVTSALEYAHDKGIVHRDVKPENIMFRGSGTEEAVLTDFGIAKSNAHQTQLTSAGMIVGTPRYMSPEQADGRGANPQSDLYALGVVLFEMISGRPPYGGKESLAVLYSHINDPIPKLPDQYSFLQPLVEDMLAKNPEDRIPNCTVLLERIKDCQRKLKQVMRRAPAEAPDNKRETSKSPSAMKKGVSTLLLYFVWGGIALASVVIITTVIWGLMSTPGKVEPEVVQYDPPAVVSDEPMPPEAETPIIVTPKKVDIVETSPEISQPMAEKPPTESADLPDNTTVMVEKTGAEKVEEAEESEAVTVTAVDINGLLELAEKQLANDQLSTPADNNAYDTFRAILKIEPGNTKAKNGLRRIADRYAEMAREQSVAGKYEQAASSAQNGLLIWPEHNYLLQVVKEIEIKAARARELDRIKSFGDNEVVDEGQKAIEKHRLAARYGYADAQFKLGLAYANGSGVDRDVNEAIQWLLKAAEQDHREAQYNLALGLIFGPQPQAGQAVKWIQELADSEYKPAYRVLGWMYTTGTGLGKNIKEAVVWSAKGTKFGAPSVPENLVTAWQGSFERAYEASLEVRDQKLAQDNYLK